jgi:hypothetical protein
MSVHKIKAGASKPTPQDLIERQIGYDTKEKNLYINISGILDNIGGKGVYGPLQESVEGNTEDIINLTEKVTLADTTLFAAGGWQDQLFADGKNGWNHPDGGLGALPALFGEGTKYDSKKPRKNFPDALEDLDTISGLIAEYHNGSEDEITIKWD